MAADFTGVCTILGAVRLVALMILMPEALMRLPMAHLIVGMLVMLALAFAISRFSFGMGARNLHKASLRGR